ncbi:MAG: aldo/keto reductase [Planctomycetota bacterium]
MNPDSPTDPQATPRPTRRQFLRSTTAVGAALGLGATAARAAPQADAPAPTPNPTNRPDAPTVEPEWRNRHPDMTYRMLGRTGFMVSELVYGGYPMKPNNIDLYVAAIDEGVNYLDQATAYGSGDGERAIAALLKHGVKRDQFFLTTKLSHYNGFVRRTYNERFKSLTGGEQEAVETLASQLLEQSGNSRPGYHVNYFGGQESNFPATYRVLAMKQLGHVAGSKDLFKGKISEILDASMKRTTVDHYDVLFCPHSVEAPESLDDEAMLERLAELKNQGRARALAFSAHNDTGENLRAGIANGSYDVAMVAYNIVNHLAMDPVLEDAAKAGMGLIAMKAARPVIVDPVDWRIAKLNTIVTDEGLSTAQKAYLFVLQNPNITAVVADMQKPEMLTENLAMTGRKTTLNLV